MQYLLSPEEYDALKSEAGRATGETLQRVLQAFSEELGKVNFREDRFGVAGALVRLPDLKDAIQRTKDRFQTKPKNENQTRTTH